MRRSYDSNFRPKNSQVRKNWPWSGWNGKLVGLTRRSDTNLTTERNVSEREIFPLTGGVKQPTPFINYMVVFIYGCLCTGLDINSDNGKKMSDLREETKSNTEYLRHFTTNVVEMWKCQWKKLKLNSEGKEFLKS